MTDSHGTPIVRAATARRVRAPHAHRRGVLMLAVLVVSFDLRDKNTNTSRPEVRHTIEDTAPQGSM